MAGSTEWYYRVGGQVVGPVDSKAMRALATDATIAPESPVRNGSDGRWISAGKIAGLFPSPTTTPPAIPPQMPVTVASAVGIPPRTAVRPFRRSRTGIVVACIVITSLIALLPVAHSLGRRAGEDTATAGNLSEFAKLRKENSTLAAANRALEASVDEQAKLLAESRADSAREIESLRSIATSHREAKEVAEEKIAADLEKKRIAAQVKFGYESREFQEAAVRGAEKLKAGQGSKLTWGEAAALGHLQEGYPEIQPLLKEALEGPLEDPGLRKMIQMLNSTEAAR